MENLCCLVDRFLCQPLMALFKLPLASQNTLFDLLEEEISALVA